MCHTFQNRCDCIILSVNFEPFRSNNSYDQIFLSDWLACDFNPPWKLKTSVPKSAVAVSPFVADPRSFTVHRASSLEGWTCAASAMLLFTPAVAQLTAPHLAPVAAVTTGTTRPDPRELTSHRSYTGPEFAADVWPHHQHHGVWRSNSSCRLLTTLLHQVLCEVEEILEIQRLMAAKAVDPSCGAASVGNWQQPYPVHFALAPTVAFMGLGCVVHVRPGCMLLTTSSVTLTTLFTWVDCEVIYLPFCLDRMLWLE